MRKKAPDTPVDIAAVAIAVARDEQRALIAAATELEACPSDSVIARIAELETKVFSLHRYRDAALETGVTEYGDIRFAGLLVGASDEAAALMNLSTHSDYAPLKLACPETS